MAKRKKDKILTQEQKEDVILFAYNMYKDGYELKYAAERIIQMESDEHKCQIMTSLFDDNKKIIVIYVENKITKKDIRVELHDVNKKNISKQLECLQSEVNDIIEENKPVYYSDDEVEDVIGDPSLLGKRSAKVEHLIENIEEKKSAKKKFRWK